MIDLHVHSNASDGSLSPTEVVQLAKDVDLSTIALTDHDTISGIDEALRAGQNLDVSVVPGVELSCFYNEKEIHILGLFIDHKSDTLITFLSDAARKRTERNHQIIEAFQKDGFDITMEEKGVSKIVSVKLNDAIKNTEQK